MRDYSRGDLIAVVSGEMVDKPTRHSLQITPEKHLHDTGFTGKLLHSCNPNTIIIPEKLEVWAAGDIRPGDALTIDYAATVITPLPKT